MLYHNIMNSDEERFVKHLVKQQESRNVRECWFGNLKEDGEYIGLEVREKYVRGKQKSAWKNEVKSKIEEAFVKEVVKRKAEGRKLRFLNVNGADTYLKNVFNDDARMAMKIRLNMIEWVDDNYGTNDFCYLCEQLNTTEHVFACKQIVKDINVSVKDLEQGQKMNEIVKLFKVTEDERKKEVAGRCKNKL